MIVIAEQFLALVMRLLRMSSLRVQEFWRYLIVRKRNHRILYTSAQIFFHTLLQPEYHHVFAALIFTDSRLYSSLNALSCKRTLVPGLADNSGITFNL